MDTQEVVIDVKDILQVHVDYGRLSVVLSTILHRLDALEKPRATEPSSPEQHERFDPSPLLARLEKLEANKNHEGETHSQHSPDIDGRIAALESRVEAVSTPGIGELETRLSKLENAEKPRIASPPGTDAGLEERVRALEDELGKLRPELADAKTVVSALSQTVSDLSDRLLGLETAGKGADQPHLKGHRDPPAATSVDPRHVLPRLEQLERELAELRDANANAAARTEEVKPQENNEREDTERLGDRVQTLEQNMALEAERRLAGLEASLLLLTNAQHSSRGEIPATSNRSNDEVEMLKRQLNELKDSLEVLTNQLKAVTAPSSAEGNTSGISEAQFAALKGSVDGLNSLQKKLRSDFEDSVTRLDGRMDGLEERLKSAALAADMRDLREGLAALTKAVKPLETGLQKLSDTKANKADIPQTNSSDAVNAKFDEVFKLIASHESKIGDIGNRSLPQAQVNSQASPSMQNKLAELEARVKQLAESEPKQVPASDAEARLAAIAAEAVRDREWASQQIIEIRATIDHIHHTKADSTQVANKAERDYVENALEKLMREVEQVMNTTNAGLIDTLDKSLGILRDMIDGKASKSDLARLRSSATDDAGVVPEGLTGYKSYRCLGCNRTVDAMRTRPMGANFSNFMNRLPASPRQAPPRTADDARRPIGLIANSPTS